MLCGESTCVVGAAVGGSTLSWDAELKEGMASIYIYIYIYICICICTYIHNLFIYSCYVYL